MVFLLGPLSDSYISFLKKKKKKFWDCCILDSDWKENSDVKIDSKHFCFIISFLTMAIWILCWPDKLTHYCWCTSLVPQVQAEFSMTTLLTGSMNTIVGKKKTLRGLLSWVWIEFQTKHVRVWDSISNPKCLWCDVTNLIGQQYQCHIEIT